MVQTGSSPTSLSDSKLSSLLAEATIDSVSTGSERVPGPSPPPADASMVVDGESSPVSSFVKNLDAVAYGGGFDDRCEGVGR